MRFASYECLSCGERYELALSDTEIAPDVECACGASVSWSRISIGEERGNVSGQVLVRDKQWDIPPEFRPPPCRWEKGNVDHEAQERRYADIQTTAAKAVDARRRDMSRRDSGKQDLVARIPRELFLARQRQYGKDYWLNEGDRALRRDGLKLPGT